MNVALCFPHHGDVKAGFALSLASLVNVTKEQRRDIALGVMQRSSSNLADTRNRLVADAVNANAEWLLLLDSDHVFPPNTLVRLLAHQKPLVGCNYRRRIGGGTIVEPKTGLEQVARLGLGVCLVHRSVFEKVPPLWFQFEGAKGEDDYFFDKAAEAGIPTYCDHDLSREVGHIGETVLRL